MQSCVLPNYAIPTFILCVEFGLESRDKFLTETKDFFNSSVDSDVLVLNSEFFVVNLTMETGASLFSGIFSIGGNATDFKFLNLNQKLQN